MVSRRQTIRNIPKRLRKNNEGEKERRNIIMKLWILITNVLIVLMVGLIAVEYPWVGLALLIFFVIGQYTKWFSGKNRRLRQRLNAIEKKLIPLQKIAWELEGMKDLFARYLDEQEISHRKEEELSYESFEENNFTSDGIYSQE